MKAGMKCDSNLVAIEIDLNVFIICFSTTHSEEHHFRLCTYRTYPKSTLKREKQSSTKLSCQVCNTTTFHQQCRHYHHLHQHRRVVSSLPSSSSFKFGSFSHHHVELMVVVVGLGGPGLPSCWSNTTVCNERPTTTTTMRCRARK